MKEQDLHKLIRKNRSDDNTVLENALREKHPELTHSANVGEKAAKKKSTRRLIAIFTPVSIAAVLVAVLIPTLLLRKADPNDGGFEAYRPAPIQDYSAYRSDYTVQEFNDINETNILYFSGYIVSDYSVTIYERMATQEFLGLTVDLVNTETGDNIEYIACKSGVDLDFLQYHLFICTNEESIGEQSIKWATAGDNSYGIFKCNDYDYYITLKNSSDKARLFEIVETLLSSQK